MFWCKLTWCIGHSSRFYRYMVCSDEKEDKPNFKEFNATILSPMRLSLFERIVGDIIGGRVNIAEILYQPKANDDFHL